MPFLVPLTFRLGEGRAHPHGNIRVGLAQLADTARRRSNNQVFSWPVLNGMAPPMPKAYADSFAFRRVTSSQTSELIAGKSVTISNAISPRS